MDSAKMCVRGVGFCTERSMTERHRAAGTCLFHQEGLNLNLIKITSEQCKHSTQTMPSRVVG